MLSCSGITPDDQKRLVEEFSGRFPSLDRGELSFAVADQPDVEHAVIAATKLVFDEGGACLNALPEILGGEFQYHCFVVVLRVLCLLGPAVYVANHCARVTVFTSWYKITHAILSFWQCHWDHNEEKWRVLPHRNNRRPVWCIIILMNLWSFKKASLCTDLLQAIVLQVEFSASLWRVFPYKGDVCVGGGGGGSI